MNNLDDLLRRLDLVQEFLVKEGLGFDDKCIAVEEARDALKDIKAQGCRLSDCESALRSLDVGRESSYWKSPE